MRDHPLQGRTRRDKSRLFIELTPEGIADLRREIAERSIPSKQSWWGYDVIQVDDPDGNELLFCLSPEPQKRIYFQQRFDALSVAVML